MDQSSRSMNARYREVVGLDDINCLYNSYDCGALRMIITRWRMSNDRLAIEKGRYAKPIIPPENRLCKIWLEIEDEDEDHVIIVHCIWILVQNIIIFFVPNIQ